MDDKIKAELAACFSAELGALVQEGTQLKRLEQNIARLGIAASMSVTMSHPSKHVVSSTDSGQWFRSLEVTNGVLLCHRPGPLGPTYAILESVPEDGFFHTLFASGNAIDVLQNFIRECWEIFGNGLNRFRSDIRRHIKEHHPQQNASALADEFLAKAINIRLPTLVDALVGTGDHPRRECRPAPGML